MEEEYHGEESEIFLRENEGIYSKNSVIKTKLFVNLCYRVYLKFNLYVKERINTEIFRQ